MSTDLRRRIVRRLRSDEWMERHFGISAHAGDVADTVLEVLAEPAAVEAEPGDGSVALVTPAGGKPDAFQRVGNQWLGVYWAGRSWRELFELGEVRVIHHG